MPGFALRRVTQQSYEDTLAALPELLLAEGFGVLTRIDVKGRLEAKLGSDLGKYEAPGAAHPQRAYLVLSTDLAAGTALPNFVVQEDAGHAVVLAIQPAPSSSKARTSGPVAAEVLIRLERVLAALG